MRVKSLVLLAVLIAAGVATMVSATLLGVDPGFPQFFYRQQKTSSVTPLNYDPATHQFVMTSLPLSLAFYLGDGQPVLAAVGDVQPQVSVSVLIDNSGNLMGPGTSRDFVVRGTVTDLNTATTYTGDLLTGRAIGFG